MVRKTAWMAMGLMGMCLLPAGGEAQQSMRRLEASGIVFQWETRDGRLHGRLSAPTTGWILVGFNRPGRGLSGARLVFLATNQDGSTTAEEHIADPPTHGARPTRGAEDRVVVEQINQQGDRTTARFNIPLNPGRGSSLELRAGEEVEVILAYSASDDLNHHSRVRQHRRTPL